MWFVLLLLLSFIIIVIVAVKGDYFDENRGPGRTASSDRQSRWFWGNPLSDDDDQRRCSCTASTTAIFNDGRDDRLRTLPGRLLPQDMSLEVLVLGRVLADDRRQQMVDISVLLQELGRSSFLRDVHHIYDHNQQHFTCKYAILRYRPLLLVLVHSCWSKCYLF